MSGESAEGGPGSASRGESETRTPEDGVTEEGLTRLGALCSMLRYYGVPRRISLGFAHSAAAVGDLRNITYMCTCVGDFVMFCVFDMHASHIFEKLLV